MLEMKKALKIIAIIGIILIIIGPILGITLNKITIVSRGPENPVVIQDSSATSIRDAYAQEVTITENQKIVIEFSAYYPNISVTLIILGKGTYDHEYALDHSPPVSGLSFIYSQFTWGLAPQNSVNDATSLTINYDGFWYIEFAGSVNTIYNYLTSIPGNYIIVVYGTNSGSSTDVRFDLNVKMDGPGAFLNTLFLSIGIILLAVAAILFSYSYLNKLRRGID
ncbi:MAG: hypothetical protein ACFFBH_01375 [Promethearchaeota archaeon]